MDFTSYIYVGLGVSVSILGFFLKRMKEEIDVLKSRNTKLEISSARDFERLRHVEKMLEDRREDIKKLFENLGK